MYQTAGTIVPIPAVIISYIFNPSQRARDYRMFHAPGEAACVPDEVVCAPDEADEAPGKADWVREWDEAAWAAEGPGGAAWGGRNRRKGIPGYPEKEIVTKYA